MLSKRNILSLLGLLVVFALLVGCGPQATEAPTEPPAEEEPAEEPAEEEEEAAEPPSEGESFLERAEAGEFDGTSVLIMGAFAGGDEEARFTAVNDRFSEMTGIEVTYEGTRDFEVVINTRVEGGDPPDVALLPQPGLMTRFADAGELVELWPSIIERIDENYASVWKDLGSYQGTPYGVFHRVNAKSFVWYPKKAFEAAGYEIPETWDELIALSDQIVADGGTPWCVGMESQAATGWVGTDWMEDVMLRTGGPDVYDQWWTHQIPFDDQAVKDAAGYIEEIWFNPDYVLGGTTSILTEHFAEGSLPMWNDPPGCYLFRQGNFVINFWPEEIQNNLDEEIGVFGFPAIDEEYGIPILGGGDQVVMFVDRPEIRAYLEYLTTGASGELWARAGGALFPHQDQNLDWYQTEVERTLADLLLNAKVFRFDASDLMPAEVGAGSFWTGMVDWVSGTDLDTVLSEIEASWPEDAGTVETGGEEEEEELTAESLGLPQMEGEVLVMGAFAGGDEEARFTAVNQRFTDLTGIEVTYEGTRDFEVVINTRVEGGDPPDVALLPQPGLKDRFAAAGDLIPLPAEVVDRIDENYAPVWKDLGSYEGTPYGVFHRVNAKSFVWYPKKAFEAAGYEIPETWDELIALSDQIVADGGTPWCVGMESQAATGWVGTDWMEDVMLRSGGPDTYDQWVSHEVPFDSEEVRDAAGYIEEIWLNPDYVLGGTTSILTEHFAEGSLPMWNDPPGCYLFRQGNFVINFWPEEVQNNLDEEVGVFGFPAIDEEYGIPVLGGGDQIVMFKDRPEVRAYLQYLTTGASGELWAKAGGALFPHQDQNLDWYQTEVERTLADLLLNAKVFRFDASDLMPAEVGAGSFWTGMVDWVSGTDLDTVLSEIDASWPE